MGRRHVVFRALYPPCWLTSPFLGGTDWKSPRWYASLVSFYRSQLLKSPFLMISKIYNSIANNYYYDYFCIFEQKILHLWEYISILPLIPRKRESCPIKGGKRVVSFALTVQALNWHLTKPISISTIDFFNIFIICSLKSTILCSIPSTENSHSIRNLEKIGRLNVSWHYPQVFFLK